MKIKYAFAALAFASAFVMPSAFADTTPVQSVPMTFDAVSGDYTAGFTAIHSGTGAFSDEFNFTPSLTSGSVSALVSSFKIFGSGVTFNSATLNGFVLTPLTPSSPMPGFTIYNLALGSQAFSGPLKLLVSGNSFGTTNSYAGSMSVTNAVPILPVPEPETYAMMLAGLGLLGFAARRKAKADQA